MTEEQKSQLRVLVGHLMTSTRNLAAAQFNEDLARRNLDRFLDELDLKQAAVYVAAKKAGRKSVDS